MNIKKLISFWRIAQLMCVWMSDRKWRFVLWHLLYGFFWFAMGTALHHIEDYAEILDSIPLINLIF